MFKLHMSCKQAGCCHHYNAVLLPHMMFLQHMSKGMQSHAAKDTRSIVHFMHRTMPHGVTARCDSKLPLDRFCMRHIPGPCEY